MRPRRTRSRRTWRGVIQPIEEGMNILVPGEQRVDEVVGRGIRQSYDAGSIEMRNVKRPDRRGVPTDRGPQRIARSDSNSKRHGPLGISDHFDQYAHRYGFGGLARIALAGLHSAARRASTSRSRADGRRGPTCAARVEFLRASAYARAFPRSPSFIFSHTTRRSVCDGVEERETQRAGENASIVSITARPAMTPEPNRRHRT